VAVVVTVTVADLVTVPAVATMLDVCAGVEPVVATWKETEVRPHETLTDAGTLKPVPFVENPMLNPVKGAAAEREATQVKEAPTATEAGVQVKVVKVWPVATPARPIIMNTLLAIARLNVIRLSPDDAQQE
jgi:hypothetical protein